MQNNNEMPILVTDSGVGGLTVLNKLSLAFPLQTFIYYSDYKNVPYGSKTKTEIKKFCRNRIDYALNHNVKLIVVACNTMSVVGKNVFSKSPIPVLGVVASDSLSADFHNKTAVMFCTPQTAKSLSISRLSRIKVIALPNLAHDIEEHIFDLNSIPDYLKKDYGRPETVILGCTHYTLIKKAFAACCNTNNIIDGTENIVDRVGLLIGEKGETENKIPCKKIHFAGSGARRTAAAYRLLFLNQ